MSNENILEQLLAGGSRVEISWKQFLTAYSNLFLKVIWQLDKDRDSVMEKYLFVCQKLAANDFAILRKFQREYGSNPPTFSTWLAAVARNLCIDAHRSTHGRRQLPRSVARLLPLKRRVFQLHYWKGHSREEIQQMLASEASAGAIADAFEQLDDVLEGSRAQLRDSHIHVPLDDEFEAGGQSNDDEKEITEWMERWLGELPPQERMILRLRFWEEMTAKEIAAGMNMENEQRVYTILRSALKQLKQKATRTLANNVSARRVICYRETNASF